MNAQPDVSDVFFISVQIDGVLSVLSHPLSLYICLRARMCVYVTVTAPVSVCFCFCCSLSISFSHSLFYPHSLFHSFPPPPPFPHSRPIPPSLPHLPTARPFLLPVLPLSFLSLPREGGAGLPRHLLSSSELSRFRKKDFGKEKEKIKTHFTFPNRNHTLCGNGRVAAEQTCVRLFDLLDNILWK